MKINKKAALHNLGCKVNAYETEAMQQILENAGYEIVPFTEYADVYAIALIPKQTNPFHAEIHYSVQARRNQ